MKFSENLGISNWTKVLTSAIVTGTSTRAPISYSPVPAPLNFLILAEIKTRESVQCAQNAKILPSEFLILYSSS